MLHLYFARRGAFWPAPRLREGRVVVVVVKLFLDERFLVLNEDELVTNAKGHQMIPDG